MKRRWFHLELHPWLPLQVLLSITLGCDSLPLAYPFQEFRLLTHSLASSDNSSWISSNLYNSKATASTCVTSCTSTYTFSTKVYFIYIYFASLSKPTLPFSIFLLKVVHNVVLTCSHGILQLFDDMWNFLRDWVSNI